jgi:hypothetical protein
VRVACNVDMSTLLGRLDSSIPLFRESHALGHGYLVRDGRAAGRFLDENVFVAVSDEELQQMASAIGQQTTVLTRSDVKHT